MLEVTCTARGAGVCVGIRGGALFKKKSPPGRHFTPSPSESSACRPRRQRSIAAGSERQGLHQAWRWAFSLSVSFCFTDSEITIKSMQMLAAVFLPC